MSEAVSATFVDGAFKPDKPLGLSPGTRVRLVFFDVEKALAAEEQQKAWDEFDRLCEECPIDLDGVHIKREQLYDRHAPMGASPIQEQRPDSSAEERLAALKEFNQICDELSVDLGGDKLTRDQLHERR